MSSHLFHLLSVWQQDKHQHRWVLGTIFQTQGPSYRKAGAMMLLRDDGERFGLLSGGCLESDIHLQAARVLDTGKSKLLRYDSSDEEDVAYLLGIGCGGIVEILLQPILACHDYLGLEQVYELMSQRTPCLYRQHVCDHNEPQYQIPITACDSRYR